MIDNKAFHTLSYGLYVISAKDGNGKDVGCIVNTFAQVASNPPMVSVSLNKENTTTRAILETKQFNASVLSERATMELIGCFGFKSSYEIDKYAEVEHRICGRGIPYVTQDCVARFSVDVVESMEAATHIVFIGNVIESEVLSDEAPMTYAYYHSVLRGKTPPKAASYDAEDVVPDAVVASPAVVAASEVAQAAAEVAAGTAEAADAVTDAVASGMPRVGWQCTMCGYIVEMEELPEDFHCPICGMGREFFERIIIPSA